MNGKMFKSGWVRKTVRGNGGNRVFFGNLPHEAFHFWGTSQKNPVSPRNPVRGLEPEATNKIRTDVFQLCSAIHTDVVTVLTQYPSEFNKALVGGR